MSLETKFLVLAAVLPAIILCIYVYKKDKVEKEPPLFLLQLFLLGMACCYPAYILEKLIIGGIDIVFSLSYSYNHYLYNLVYYFVGVAFVEEGLKWLALRFFAVRDENFNCFFDGLIYAVFVSLGFAALENILYVTSNGWINAFMRGVLSVPGHMFFSVMMGYYLSWWKILKQAEEIETELAKKYKSSNRIYFNSKANGVLSLVMPIVLHGIYNYCCSESSTLFTVLFMLFIAFLYVFCFGRIKKMSQADDYNRGITERLLTKKYPSVPAEIVREYVYGFVEK